MNESKKFAFDIGITFIASVISMILGFVITILLGRHLGAGDLGLYRMVCTIYGIAMLIGGLGIPVAMIKYVAEYRKDKNKSDEVASSGVITSLLLGIGFSILFYFSSGIFERIFNMQGLSGLLKILAPVFPFALVGGSFLGLLNGLREMKKYAMATIIQSVLMLVVSVVLIYWGFGIAGAVIGIVLSSAGSCLFLVRVSKGYFEFTLEGYIQTTKKMFSFGWKIIAVNWVNQINYDADTILLGYFLTAADVGYYGVAIGLSRFFWLVPSAIQTITYPVTSEYWANTNHRALQTMIDKSMKYTACILLPIGLGIGFFANDIVTLIFGKSFIYVVFPLRILIIGTVIYGIIKAVGSFFTGIGRPDLSLKIDSAGAIVNLVLNISLIPLFGISGAAFAAVASFVVMAILLIYLMIKIGHINININTYVQLGIITILAVALFMALSRINLYFIGLLILSVYIVSIFLFVLTDEDKQMFKSLLYSSLSKKSV